jgi:hypothetical protein
MMPPKISLSNSQCSSITLFKDKLNKNNKNNKNKKKNKKERRKNCNIDLNKN